VSPFPIIPILGKPGKPGTGKPGTDGETGGKPGTDGTFSIRCVHPHACAGEAQRVPCPLSVLQPPETRETPKSPHPNQTFSRVFPDSGSPTAPTITQPVSRAHPKLSNSLIFKNRPQLYINQWGNRGQETGDRRNVFREYGDRPQENTGGQTPGEYGDRPQRPRCDCLVL